VAEAMVKPLHAIIRHHLLVPDVGPIIIEGDGILPGASSQFGESDDVCTVFIVEEDEVQLLHNLQSRGRGFVIWVNWSKRVLLMQAGSMVNGSLVKPRNYNCL
jgi:hypothetical protein